MGIGLPSTQSSYKRLQKNPKFIKQKNFLAKIIKKKRERAQIDKIRNEKEVTTDTT